MQRGQRGGSRITSSIIRNEGGAGQFEDFGHSADLEHDDANRKSARGRSLPLRQAGAAAVSVAAT